MQSAESYLNDSPLLDILFVSDPSEDLKGRKNIWGKQLRKTFFFFFFLKLFFIIVIANAITTFETHSWSWQTRRPSGQNSVLAYKW